MGAPVLSLMSVQAVGVRVDARAPNPDSGGSESPRAIDKPIAPAGIPSRVRRRQGAATEPHSAPLPKDRRRLPQGAAPVGEPTQGCLSPP